jgi:phage baseplate assembly protein W
MAYRIPNKNPIDTEQRVAVGVSIPFNSPQVFTQTYTTTEQIKSNIINFVLTNKGERVFNPTFGSNIRKYVFEQITPTSVKSLQTQLLEELSLYFPNVRFANLIITPIFDENTINIQINYSVYGDSLNEINITL